MAAAENPPGSSEETTAQWVKEQLFSLTGTAYGAVAAMKARFSPEEEPVPEPEEPIAELVEPSEPEVEVAPMRQPESAGCFSCCSAQGGGTPAAAPADLK